MRAKNKERHGQIECEHTTNNPKSREYSEERKRKTNNTAVAINNGTQVVTSESEAAQTLNRLCTEYTTILSEI